MKVSRNQLKGIVKECLMEILAEGLLHDEPRPTQGRKVKKQAPMVESKKDQFSSAVKSTVSSLTNDSIMSGILEDTARTTLQEQMSAEKSPRSAMASAAKVEDDLGGLFGESADRWANLAFADKKS